MRENKEVVSAAVSQNGYALRFASPHLQDDEEIVLTALKNKVGSLKYASERIQKLAHSIRGDHRSPPEILEWVMRMRNIKSANG